MYIFQSHVFCLAHQAMTASSPRTCWNCELIRAPCADASSAPHWGPEVSTAPPSELKKIETQHDVPCLDSRSHLSWSL